MCPAGMWKEVTADLMRMKNSFLQGNWREESRIKFRRQDEDERVASGSGGRTKIKEAHQVPEAGLK